jgi:anti-sigma B factor antagonist
MSIRHIDLSPAVRHIVLAGRLDISGTDEIARELTQLTSSAAGGVVVDLSEVTFLASIGIRALITSAKTVQQRGSKLVLRVASNAEVSRALDTTGIPALIPTFTSLEEASNAAG